MTRAAVRTTPLEVTADWETNAGELSDDALDALATLLIQLADTEDPQ